MNPFYKIAIPLKLLAIHTCMQLDHTKGARSNIIHINISYNLYNYFSK